MPTGDLWIIRIGAVFLITLLVVVGLGWLDPSLSQTVVLAATAWVILWYTVETMRLRREAEARAERDREPRVTFDVTQFYDLLSDSGEYPLRFHFTNHSPNPAFASVWVRLRMGSQGAVLSQNHAYNGTEIWEVLPFFQLQGRFDLLEIIKRAQDTSRDFKPTGTMTMNVQVCLYWPNRKRFITLKREYHVDIEQNGDVYFWPEISTSLPLLNCPDELP